MVRPKPTMLMILDGWGIAAAGPGNAVQLARTPALDHLFQTCPHTRLFTSGDAVGLPEGVMGNSEVGHLNIGAGRVVYQDLLRIDKAIADGTFFNNPTMTTAMRRAVRTGGKLHLMGLVSDGGVHSQLTHLFALLDLAGHLGMKQVFVHVILDGRDTPPDKGVEYVRALEKYMSDNGCGRIATVCGRFYAMDRDTRWQRTEKAFRLYTEGLGVVHTDPVVGIEQSYRNGESDEFVKPIVIAQDDGSPYALVEDGDTIVFFNFRADRARQLTSAFTETEFSGFARVKQPRLDDYICMTTYDEHFGLPVVFPPERLESILGSVVSEHGLRQLRIAETEKYAHVTYFFNGGEEKAFPGEDRCLIPSVRDVPTYDHKPEMSAVAVTEEVLQRIASDRYEFIVLNFANMDMVGHTGVLAAAIKACETVDGCVGRIVQAVTAKGGALIITADHGNAETMLEENGKIHTAHTTNPVPLILVSEQHRRASLREGVLGDIAPTILELMGLDQPAQMTGKSLIEAGSERQ